MQILYNSEFCLSASALYTQEILIQNKSMTIEFLGYNVKENRESNLHDLFDRCLDDFS